MINNKMNAFVLHQIGDLRYEEVNVPELDQNSVLVKVKAAGICGSDIARTFKTGTYSFPLIMGHEFCGQVVQLGSQVDQKWQNKRVAVFPLIPCRKCRNCLLGKYEMCANYNYLGSRCNGAFADFALVPEWNLLEIPDEVSFEQAAMLEPTAVAVHAIRRSKIQIGDTVAIYGPGTIGLILAQLARIAGAAKVLLIGRNDEKLKIAETLGFNDTCNLTNVDPIQWILEKTDGLGVNMAVEGTGTGEILNLCLESVMSEGVIVTMGNPASDFTLAKNSYWKILRKQLTVVGTWNSSFGIEGNNDWKSAIEFIRSGQLDLETLITHKLNSNQLSEGLEIMRNNNIISNKIMLTNYD